MFAKSVCTNINIDCKLHKFAFFILVIKHHSTRSLKRFSLVSVKWIHFFFTQGSIFMLANLQNACYFDHQLVNVGDLESCRSPRHLERSSFLSHTESFSFLSALQSQLVKSNLNGLLYRYYSYQCLIRFKLITKIYFVARTKQLKIVYANKKLKHQDCCPHSITRLVVVYEIHQIYITSFAVWMSWSFIESL